LTLKNSSVISSGYQKIVPPVLALLAATVMLASAAWGHFQYTWYHDMRILVCACAAFAAYDAHRRELMLPVYVLAVVAVLFNLVVQFQFRRSEWRPLDIAAMVVCVAIAAWHVWQVAKRDAV